MNVIKVRARYYISPLIKSLNDESKYYEQNVKNALESAKIEIVGYLCDHEREAAYTEKDGSWIFTIQSNAKIDLIISAISKAFSAHNLLGEILNG